MEHYAVKFSPKAYNDLKNINEYICKELLEPDIAHEMSRLITDEISKLEYFPFRNPKVMSEKIKHENLRKMLVKNYIIFYDVDENSKLVNIHRILYAYSDWIKDI